jgi:uncharacterized RDD family membrane protein YckC
MSLALRRSSRTAVRGAAGATAAEPAVLEAAPPRAYVGLVTRALAFALDAAAINAVAILTAGIVTLVLSVVSVPDELSTALAAAAGGTYVLWSVGYFVTFWATTGQTPGSRLLGIAVQTPSGGRVGPLQALVRFGALTLAAIPLGAGFLLILFDDRRRGLHDRLAHTVVVEAEDEEPPDTRRRRPPPAR